MNLEKTILPAVEKAVLELNVLLSKDGGRLELTAVTPDGIVRLRLHGVCAECAGSLPPLAKGIEKVILDQIPTVHQVVVLPF
jgi:Fe-S cluster biogenesis protein NfuA